MARPELLDVRPSWGGASSTPRPSLLGAARSQAECGRAHRAPLLGARDCSPMVAKSDHPRPPRAIPSSPKSCLAMLHDVGHITAHEKRMDRLRRSDRRGRIPPIDSRRCSRARLDQLPAGRTRRARAGAVSGRCSLLGMVTALCGGSSAERRARASCMRLVRKRSSYAPELTTPRRRCLPRSATCSSATPPTANPRSSNAPSGIGVRRVVGGDRWRARLPSTRRSSPITMPPRTGTLSSWAVMMARRFAIGLSDSSGGARIVH